MFHFMYIITRRYKFLPFFYMFSETENYVILNDSQVFDLI